jgi:hypothetical protein
VKAKPLAILLTAAAFLSGSAILTSLGAQTPAPAPTGTARPASGPVSRQKTVQMRGFSMRLVEHSPEGVQSYLDAIDELADMGCTWINLSIATYQNDVHAERITLMNWNEVPSEKDILRIMAKAKSRGMGVMLMPVVLLSNSGAKDWRGVIHPGDDGPTAWDNWFAAYNAFIMKCAHLAHDGDVDIFCVGSELLSTETFRDRWVDQIDQIKSVYKGKLTYSANWDHYEVVTFWDKLDYVGMNNYNELASMPGVPVPELIKAWQPIKDKVLKFAAEKKKPFMFTEVGWHNLQNTLAEPWNYVAEGAIDHTEQLHAFESFVDTWKDVPKDKFMGAFIWEWYPGGKVVNGNFSRGTYSLQSTPALEVVKKWFAMP